MEPCIPNCPANEAEHFDILCPENSTCNGVPNNHDEHECMLFCCFPLNLFAYIITMPCCICNICCSMNNNESDTVCTDIELSSPTGNLTSTVCTGLVIQCNATGVTPILHSPGMGLEFSVGGNSMPVQTV